MNGIFIRERSVHHKVNWVKQCGTMTFGDYSPATEMIGVAERPGKKVRHVRSMKGGGGIAYAWPKGEAHRFYGEAGQSNVWWLVDREDVNAYVHPTQKPVALPLRAILNSSQAEDVVLDAFGGSGSTLIACEKAGRRGALIEIDPKWCDVIRRRWHRFTTGADDGWRTRRCKRRRK
jgi:DNA modification methylase